ncbi:hypothetical protein TRFO_05143 [Tritrichomonas foetus]|uniref:Ubiquitin-like domain-containing protein n=1 Tax=Tritrichomonas foetus TaxID=1144522 RepID=A0A1J4KCU7_9EUKA|nr:hypothetical protein TRFO_05143 [Tritrichomonas foetus]|eukprot:OHT07524.1 hypothetical protein TRFO_05143 [Tritrichomonas foetus]
MKIFVKILHFPDFFVIVTETDFVSDLKYEIGKHLNIPESNFDQIFIFFSGKTCHDFFSLANYGIKDRSIVYCYIKKVEISMADSPLNDISQNSQNSPIERSLSNFCLADTVPSNHLVHHRNQQTSIPSNFSDFHFYHIQQNIENHDSFERMKSNDLVLTKEELRPKGSVRIHKRFHDFENFREQKREMSGRNPNKRFPTVISTVKPSEPSCESLPTMGMMQISISMPNMAISLRKVKLNMYNENGSSKVAEEEPPRNEETKQATTHE